MRFESLHQQLEDETSILQAKIISSNEKYATYRPVPAPRKNFYKGTTSRAQSTVAPTSTQTMQRPKQVLVGDSNMRNCSHMLNNDNNINSTLWCIPGAKIVDTTTRLKDMTSRYNDAIALHLGTNDVLNAISEGQAMIGISDALDEIRKSSSVPIIVCAVPPTKKTQHDKLIGMVNNFVKYQCEKFPTTMSFLNPGLKISDIQDDGIHL